MKKMHLLMVVLSLIIPLTSTAVTIENQLSQAITIHDVSFMDGREIYMCPFELEPGTMCEHDFASVYITTVIGITVLSEKFTNLTRESKIIINEEWLKTVPTVTFGSDPKLLSYVSWGKSRYLYDTSGSRNQRLIKKVL